MASGVYNKGKYLIASGDLDWTTDTIKCLLTTSSYTPNADHNFVSDVTNELSGGSYARVTVSSGKTVTEDDANDKAAVDADNVTFTTLGAAAGTPAYAVVYRDDGVGDSSHPLIAWIELTAPYVPNGSNYTIAWNASGLFSIT